MERIKFIADVGSNFNGSLELAKKYVKICKKIGLDIVKFQCWRKEDIFSKYHPALSSTGEKNFGLPLEWHKDVKEVADHIGITVSTTPTQPYQIEKLEELGMKIYKIASGDLTYFPLIDEINRTGKSVIVSTGMATLSEIERAIARLHNCKEIVILHCTSLYPPDFSEVNLRAIETLKKAFPEYSIGISDHTPGYEVVVEAVPIGISYVEKHITLSKEFKTPDASFSLQIEEFKELIEKTRCAERSLGNGKKFPSQREIPERFWARRGTYAKTPLKAGEIIKFDKLAFLRPLKGIPAEDYEIIIGKKTKKNIEKGEPISYEDIE